MKIKTITCHKVYNYGASLQEMALVEFLNKSGYDAESIAYTPNYLTDPHKLFVCLSPNWNKNYFLKMIYILIKFPSRLKLIVRQKRFNSFEKINTLVTKETFLNNEDLKKLKNSADVFICGSDQIWNPIFPNGRDPAFYLNFAQGGKAILMSYAASFATETIPEDNVEFVKSNVRKLDFISVRETSGEKLLNSLGFNSVEQVLDPVFLLSEDYWLTKIGPRLISKKYILIYDFDTNIEIEKIAKKLAKTEGFILVGINQNLNYVNRNLYLHGPDVFLNLLKYADLILTTSFHALAFALIFKKRIGVFNRNISINTRMRDLLHILDLSDYLFNSSSELSLKHFEIDYDIVEKVLDTQIQRSKKFLIESISGLNSI